MITNFKWIFVLTFFLNTFYFLKKFFYFLFTSDNFIYNKKKESTDTEFNMISLNL